MAGKVVVVDEPGDLPKSNLTKLSEERLWEHQTIVKLATIPHSPYSYPAGSVFVHTNTSIQKMKKIITLISLLAISNIAIAQTGTSAIVVSGGPFGAANNRVVVQKYTYPNQLVSIDSIPSSAVTGVFCSASKTVVTTTAELSIYNQSGTRLARTSNLSGARAPILINDSVGVALFGFGVGSGKSTIRFFNANSGAITDTIAVTREASHALVQSGKLFVSLPGGFPSTEGQIAVIDIASRSLNRTINFGSGLANIGQLFSMGDSVLALASISFGSATGGLARINAQNLDYIGNTTPHPVGNSFGVVPSLIGNFNLIGSFNAAGTISQLSFPTQVLSGIYINKQIAGADIDRVNNRLVFTNPEYVSNGKLYVYSITGEALDSVTVGVSPEWVKVIPAGPNAVRDQLPDAGIRLYPNPATNQVHVNGDAKELSFTDISGRATVLPVLNGVVAVSHLQAGIYLVKPVGSYKPIKLIVR